MPGRKPHRTLIRLAAAACVLASGAAAAPADTVTESTDGGFGRMLFTFTPMATPKAIVTGGVLTITFDRKVAIDPAAIANGLSGYITSARGDSQTFRFALSQSVRLHSSISANHIAIDLVPASMQSDPPDLALPPPKDTGPVDVSKLPILAVRSGSYQDFTRLTFDWPRSVHYTMYPGVGRLGIRFDALAQPDLSTIARFAPPWVKNASFKIEGRTTLVEFDTDQASGFHDFRDKNRIVVDVLSPKTDADSYRPPGMKPVAFTKFKPSGVSAAQAAAIAATAQQLADANKPAQPPAPAPPPSPPAPPATPLPAPAAAGPAAPPTADANGLVTRDGAVLTFAGAANRGSAVFVRGLTAWIVLQGAAPLDALKLKTALRDFPQAVEASSADNISVLRITLKQPEQIAARAEGSTLKVIIAPQVNDSPIAIGFARNQDDATHSSLSTLLPGATKPVTVTDPVAGDQLVLIPAAAGRAMITPHDFVEFSVLKTASGLVVSPAVDDLTVTIDRTRVTITHPGGLSLTAPSMPVADSPAAIASHGQSPSFIDFAGWSRMTAGSFLATERRLRAAASRRPSAEAAASRLRLARFYLANSFSAEALGLINLMQNQDPSLQSDAQLQTMRAAANFMMGRLRDAHNAVAGAQFDADRHAALWRGLIEAAQEDWANASTDLARAEPVLNQYPAEWQARQRIGKAQAALGLGHLEVADAAISRLPQGVLPKPLMLDSAIVHARLLAAENRGRDAGRMFDAIEKSGDEHAAAQSIFYRTQAAYRAGVMNRNDAITSLEGLRFRWRGDHLELATLRELSDLYFSAGRWRDGLHTLRAAALNFPNEDMARKAQDDMRAAFVSLFLKGKADKLPPVEQLAIFYDFIDLTPIGPEGDEMIRRMADRLVSVDLLSPAEDLLSYQINKRLDGVARAQVAAKLAMIQLLDQKPQDAINTLRQTQISTAPDDVNHQRLLLEARAFAALKQWDNAIDLIAVDQAPDTQHLRADIYWESGNWAMAGKSAEDMLANRYSDAAPLSATEREDVMRAAVAYSLANDEASLDRLRDHFGPKMKASPDGNAFAVIADRIDAHGAAFREKAAQIASIDTLQAFMKDFRTKYAGTATTTTN
jgi:hypothetical protein